MRLMSVPWSVPMPYSRSIERRWMGESVPSGSRYVAASSAGMLAIFSAIGSRTSTVALVVSSTMSISKRSSSHRNSASSYWFLRIALKL